MRYRILGGAAAAALGLAAITWALPVSAQVARFHPALANGADAGELLTLVRERGGGGGGGSGGSGGGGGGRADRGGGGGDRVLRMDRGGGGGERFVNRDRDRREFGSRSDSRSDASRVTRVVRDRDGKRRRVVVHRFYNYPHWGWGAGFGLGYGVASYAGYCMSQFQAYDPVSGLYLGHDGLWYSCP